MTDKPDYTTLGLKSHDSGTLVSFPFLEVPAAASYLMSLLFHRLRVSIKVLQPSIFGRLQSAVSWTFKHDRQRQAGRDRQRDNETDRQRFLL